MIYSVRGALQYKEMGTAVVECGGVGYLCQISANTLAALPALGQEVTLLCSFQVRTDAVDLFGFYTVEERECFRRLITVSGIGPKVALSILSHFTPERLSFAIASGDVRQLTECPGVGKRTAERMIVELRDRMSVEGLSGAPGAELPSAGGAGSNQNEALHALMVLGYSKSEAADAVRPVDGTLPIEEIVRQALAGLVRR